MKEDELIRVNPCRIPGADQEHPAERPVLTVGQVMTLADKMPERYCALVLLATFGCLRWGEVAALQRCDVDLDAGTVRVRRAFTEQRGKGMVLGPPKSQAGLRTVSVPASIMAHIREHMDTHVKERPDSFVFTTDGGKTIWRGNFNKLVNWRKVVGEMGTPGLQFHDLRHTGNTLAAQTGTSRARAGRTDFVLDTAAMVGEAVRWVLLYRTNEGWRFSLRHTEPEDGIGCGALAELPADAPFERAAEALAGLLELEFGVTSPLPWQQTEPHCWGADVVPA